MATKEDREPLGLGRNFPQGRPLGRCRLGALAFAQILSYFFLNFVPRVISH
jgi:hypothetical protein